MAETFIDLLPELEAKAAKNRDASPHRIAREFVLEKGRVRGGVEVIVAIDGRGRFIAAGTQDRIAAVDFPPAVFDLLQDSSANLTIHHNHPPAEEPFFSKIDMSGLAENRGMGWLLVHTETGYSAMRASDWLFIPDASGHLPAHGLVPAYQSGRSAAQFVMYKTGTDGIPDATEAAASELALQALHQANLIEHYSSLKTGLSNEQEQGIILYIRDRCAVDDPDRFGGAAVWSGPARSALPAASGGEPGSDRQASVSHSSTLETGFERFVSILSRQDAASHDPGKAGRPQPPKFPEAGGDGAGLASGGANTRPVLETRPRRAVKLGF